MPTAAVPSRITPLALFATAVLAAAPAPLAAQRTEHGDWYHVARADSAASGTASFAGTAGLNGAGEMRVFCGDRGTPVVAFLHPPLVGTRTEADVRLFFEHDSVTTRHEGDVAPDRRSTRIPDRAFEAVRLMARDDDRLHVRIETADTAGGAVGLLLSAVGLRDAVRQLECVRPLADTGPIRPRIVNPQEVAETLRRLYPPLLRDAGIGDTVNVRLLVDRSGRVREAAINEPSRHPEFDEAALDVVEVMRFTPAYNGPHRVSLWVALDVTFEVSAP
ncbi:MAG: energy transducer TonB [Candidatus Longimicrobiales bacterium M2_2A_002]